MALCSASPACSARALPLAAAARRPRRAAARPPRAAAQPPRPDGGGGPADLLRTWDSMLARYDFLSAGMGALAVTGVCWARGQDPVLALEITAAATVVALLLNDAMSERR